jgi:hypothetical protein
MAYLAPAYQPRRPTETVLYGLVRQNLETFLAYARRHYDGGLPRFVEAESLRHQSTAARRSPPRRRAAPLATRG